MQYTENYDLKKPDLTDNYSVSNDNYNSDIIDTNLKELSDDIVGIPNQTYITEKAKIADVNSAIGLKADKTELDSVNSQLAEKANKSEVTNIMTPKGNLAYASLPTTGNVVGWYYYCPDGDGTHGAGNYVWNGTAWYFGGTGDEGYHTISLEINKLNEDLGSAPIISEVTGTVSTGIGIDARNGNERTEFVASLSTGFINVPTDGSSLIYTGSIYYFIGIAGYDENGNYVQSILSADAGVGVDYTDYQLEIPSTVKKIRASSYKLGTGAVFTLVIKKKTYGANISVRVATLENNTSIVNHIYVSANGNDETGDGTKTSPYATIYHANEVITDNTKENKYVIHVADGTYTDLQARYAGTASGTYEGVICKDYVDYIGNVAHPEKVVISWDGSTGYVAETLTVANVIDKSPFHIVGYINTPYHTSIKGFKFVGHDLRYPIHVETQAHGLDYEWEIAYCDFSGYTGRTQCVTNGTNNGSSMPSIGMGSTCGEVGEIHHCKFPVRPTIGAMASYHLGIVNHDNVPYPSEYVNIYMLAGAIYDIHDCNFNGNDILVRSLYDIAYDTPNQILLSNCTNIKSLIHDESNGIQSHWVRNLINCIPITDEF